MVIPNEPIQTHLELILRHSRSMTHFFLAIPWWLECWYFFNKRMFSGNMLVHSMRTWRCEWPVRTPRAKFAVSPSRGRLCRSRNRDGRRCTSSLAVALLFLDFPLHVLLQPQPIPSTFLPTNVHRLELSLDVLQRPVHFYCGSQQTLPLCRAPITWPIWFHFIAPIRGD